MAEKRSVGRRLAFTVIGLAFTLFIICILGEIIIRFSYDPYPPEAVAPYNYRDLDDEIGWVAKANYEYEGEMSDASERKYPLMIETNEEGFRMYGNPKSEKPKVFFIGDSYTFSLEVSNDKLFYKLIQDSLDIEVFAYGVAGYGNIQEYLILERYLEQIQPDIIVLQLCTNDFIDNYCALEVNAGYQVLKRRPYLSLEDEIYYDIPIPWVRRTSYLYAFLQDKLYQHFPERKPQATEGVISEQKRDYADFDNSVKVTELILKRFKERVPEGTTFAAFPADLFEPYFTEFQGICGRLEIPFMTEIPQAIHRMRHEKGIEMHAYDGYHWNEAGHQVVGGLIQAWLAKELSPPLVPAPPQP